MPLAAVVLFAVSGTITWLALKLAQMMRGIGTLDMPDRAR